MKKTVELIWDILLAVSFFVVTRFLLTGIQFGLNDLWQIALLIGITFYFVYTSVQKKGLSLREIGLSLPKKNHWLLSMGVLIPALFYIPSLLFPGRWVSQPWNAETWRSVFLPVFLHSGLGSGISEELLFRGYLLKHTEKQCGKMQAVMITSLVFGLVHLLNGFSSAVDALWMVFNTGMLGAILAMLTYVTGSLVYPMIVHAMINLSSVFVAAGTGGSPARFYYLMEGTAVSMPVFYGGVGIGLVLILTFLIWHSKKYLTDK
ncbi:MAG: CPBP family intramembrane metalloprotease [Clostridia bacterium]|nr:CPBP family intramembrane metalloprotease [Clostridia bacterium]